jgi:tyrosinase
MRVEIAIASSDHDARVFLTWTPVQCTARLLEGPGAGQSVKVSLRNAANNVGKVVFDVARTHRGSSTLQLDLPGDGSPVRFWMAGEFQHPSVKFGDAIVEVSEVATSAILNSTSLMVRIRKDANKLTAEERDRFLAAFGELNRPGTGRFNEFREMHVSGTLRESHGNFGFLPWHRSYLLDLERELQGINAMVALPYWRFDQAAPNLFTREFMGLPNTVGRLQFAQGHPFEQWATLGQVGINRPMNFAPANRPPGLRNEQTTIAFGSGVFRGFSRLTTNPNTSGIERNPHGLAHTSFGGFIQSPPTAPRDPLFFLLHANVDRLWAKWQWFFKRTRDSDPDAYAAGNQPGHNIGDTMWPWNGVTGGGRPATAPGGNLAASALTSAPGPSPTVRSMIDYQAVNGGAHLGFDYDDVPFEMPDPPTG